MRTTLTIEPDIERLLQREMRRTDRASGEDPFDRCGHGTVSRPAVDESAPWWAALTVAGGGQFCFYAGDSRACSVLMK